MCGRENSDRTTGARRGSRELEARRSVCGPTYIYHYFTSFIVVVWGSKVRLDNHHNQVCERLCHPWTHRLLRAIVSLIEPVRLSIIRTRELVVRHRCVNAERRRSFYQSRQHTQPSAMHHRSQLARKTFSVGSSSSSRRSSGAWSSPFSDRGRHGGVRRITRNAARQLESSESSSASLSCVIVSVVSPSTRKLASDTSAGWHSRSVTEVPSSQKHSTSRRAEARSSRKRSERAQRSATTMSRAVGQPTSTRRHSD